MASVPVDRRTRRWREQRWLLDSIIAAVGVDWDQPRSFYLQFPCGPDAAPDFEAVRRRVKKFDDIAPAFAAAAARRETLAERARTEGRPVAAREHFFTASILWGGAQWPIFENSARAIEYDARKVECYRAYIDHADHPVERVEIPFGGESLPGYLHLPPNAPLGLKLPCVVSIDGMDSVKEAIVALYGDKLLERGVARLAVDGPGQGECCVRNIHVTGTNHHDAGKAIIGWVRRRPEVDPDRVAITGVSFGSFWATQMAADDDRLRGCAVSMVCHEPGARTLFEAASPTFKLRFMYMAGIAEEDRFDEFAGSITLDGWGERLRCPYLAIAGEDDELSPIRYTYDLLGRVRPPKTLLVYEGEGHTMGLGPAGQLGPNWMSFQADWLLDRLNGRPLGSSRIFVDRAGQEHTGPIDGVAVTG